MGKVAKSKKLYKGVFSLGGEIIVRHLHAASKDQAKVFFIRRIAREKKLTGMGGLFKVFDGGKSNYVIEEVPNESK